MSSSYHRHVCFLTSQHSAPDCGSNPGWRKNNNICYYYNDTDIVDFHTAVTRCYAEKATLVSILNRDEQAYVNSMVRFFSLTSYMYIICCNMLTVKLCVFYCSLSGGDRTGFCRLDRNEDVWYCKWTIHVCVFLTS